MEHRQLQILYPPAGKNDKMQMVWTLQIVPFFRTFDNNECFKNVGRTYYVNHVARTTQWERPTR